MKNYTIETNFVSHEGTKARAEKTGINFMIFILIFVENCLQFDAVHNFSVCLRTGYNPTDINRFRSHTWKINWFSPTNVKNPNNLVWREIVKELGNLSVEQLLPCQTGPGYAILKPY